MQHHNIDPTRRGAAPSAPPHPRHQSSSQQSGAPPLPSPADPRCIHALLWWGNQRRWRVAPRPNNGFSRRRPASCTSLRTKSAIHASELWLDDNFSIWTPPRPFDGGQVRFRVVAYSGDRPPPLLWLGRSTFSTVEPANGASAHPILLVHHLTRPRP
jgi:hypothetical protein